MPAESYFCCTRFQSPLFLLYTNAPTLSARHMSITPNKPVVPSRTSRNRGSFFLFFIFFFGSGVNVK